MRAVKVHTMIVSMNGSRPATTPSLTGSFVLTAEWAIGEEPCPASLEKIALFMPKRKADETVPPINAPLASVGENADEIININKVGISLKLTSKT
mgnify:CR=1 FL=1